MTQTTRILIVAARDDQRRTARQALALHDFEIVEAPEYTAAHGLLLDSHFDLIVIESDGAARDNIEFIKRVRATPQLAGILILIVAEWGTGEPTLALAAGADAFEPIDAQPFDPSRLIPSIERLLGRQMAAAKQEVL
jgi:DNA-binding response OmpR family regulator